MLFWQFVLLLHFRFSEIQNFPSGIAHRHSNTKLHVIKTLDNRILLYIEKVEHFLPSPFMENYYLRKQRWYFVTAILKPSKYTKYISFFFVCNFPRTSISFIIHRATVEYPGALFHPCCYCTEAVKHISYLFNCGKLQLTQFAASAIRNASWISVYLILDRSSWFLLHNIVKLAYRFRILYY